MAMTRAQFAKLLQQGLNTVWGLEYNSYPEEWKQVFMTSNSDKAFEEDQLVTGFGGAVVKPEGTAITYDEASQGWTARYNHETIALAFNITEEAIEDNLYMQAGAKYVKALARSMQHTKEIKGASILNNGFDSNYAIGDGQPLFSASHPLAGGGTASNLLGTPADLAEASIESLLIQIRKTKDDRNIPVAIKPTDVIVPPDVEYIATRLLVSNYRTGTSNNDVSAIVSKSIFGKDPKVITRLTDSNAWYIKTDCPDGLKMFQRVSVQNKMEQDFNTGNFRYKARERYAFGVTDWRGIFGSAGST